MDSIALVGPDWKGYDALKYLFVFGASYCDVGYTFKSPHPTQSEPLGVPFPGKTYAGKGKPNWVGYMTRGEFCPSGSESVETRNTESDSADHHHPTGTGTGTSLLVFDYALGGAIVADVRSQVCDQFLESAGKKPDWAIWSAEDSLFSIWIGINDCGMGLDPAESIYELFKIVEKLYESGARNFLLINVPPILRAPISLRQGRVTTTARQDPNQTWNTILQSSARTFFNDHPDTSIFIFSSWNLFNKVLDDPVSFRFKKEDATKACGGIWVDRLHPTTEMHRLIAERITGFLRGVKGKKEGEREGEGRNGNEDIDIVFG